MKVIPNKTTGDSYTADEFTDGIKIELQSIVSNTGQILTQANQTQLMQAITRIASASGFYTDTGTPNVYQLVLANSFIAAQITAYYPGLTVEFLANGVNTGSATASVAGLTATNIEDGFGNNLTGGEIQPNSIAKLVFQDTPNRWVLVRPAGTPRVRARIGETGNVIGNAIGVSSVDTSTPGRYNLSLITPFANANYSIAAVVHDITGAPTSMAVVDDSSTASIIKVITLNSNTHLIAPSDGGISVQAWENN